MKKRENFAYRDFKKDWFKAYIELRESILMRILEKDPLLCPRDCEECKWTTYFYYVSPDTGKVMCFDCYEKRAKEILTIREKVFRSFNTPTRLKNDNYQDMEKWLHCGIFNLTNRQVEESASLEIMKLNKENREYEAKEEIKILIDHLETADCIEVSKNEHEFYLTAHLYLTAHQIGLLTAALTKELRR